MEKYGKHSDHILPGDAADIFKGVSPIPPAKFTVSGGGVADRFATQTGVSIEAKTQRRTS